MIGIYGGTFNPVHNGHLRTALEVKQALNLNDMRLLPCHIPAHRQQPEVSAELRLAMLKLAVVDTPELQIDDRELKRSGTSYMVDTLCSLREEYPDSVLLLVIGADAFAGLQHWYQWQRLFDYAHVVVMSRPGSGQPALNAFFQQRLITDSAQLQHCLFGHLFFQEVTMLDISASYIRQCCAEAKSPQFLLPESVLAFIRQQGLYRSLSFR